MQNIVVDMHEKIHNDRLRNNRALVHWKSHNNNKKKKNKNNVRGHWDPFPGPKMFLLQRLFWDFMMEYWTLAENYWRQMKI